MPPPCVNAGKPELDDADRDEAPENTFTELFARTNPKPRTAATATVAPPQAVPGAGGTLPRVGTEPRASRCELTLALKAGRPLRQPATFPRAAARRAVRAHGP